MRQYRMANNIIGWIVFLIAAVTYISTMEQTASFWDCGEFIAVSYKLMVPHPPGAPLFLMIGRMFSLLAGDDKSQVAYWVNMISALSSAFTILFMYWSLVYLGQKLVHAFKSHYKMAAGLTKGNAWLIMLGSVVGSLAYTWSDSFWFSAVEAEVYALSSCFTAIVFWATLKWDSISDEPGADRWIIFIAYMIGLSIGVHLLSLLVVPALALLFYFRKYKNPTFWGTMAAFAVGFGGIFFIQSFIIPGLPSLASSIEIFFVNGLGLPFNSGVIFFVILLLGGLIYGYRYAVAHGKYYLHLGLLSMFFILIGYLSFGIVLIRANDNPPLNENNPDNVISFVSYLKREQYGDRPILYGPQYNAQPEKQEKGAPVYIKKGSKYVEVERRIENIYNSKDKVFFPRLYSQQGSHFYAYSQWVKLPADRSARPSSAANWGFFFKYQLGHMYFRYMLWNFAGRAGDLQDSGWLTPFDSNSDLPDSIGKSKARNQFFAIPLIIGLIGLVIQLLVDEKSWFVVASVFFTTGISLIIYANPPPAEPRERDYVFAGSTYAFSMWIGLGVIGIALYLERFLHSELGATAIASLIGFIAPVLMVKEGYDDHDRSGRWHSIDSARNLLESCAPNAILFTGGDNDTFPVWYLQEVEGVRTDVRVCNLSLLGTDWYAGQMKVKYYDSEPAPMALTYDNFVTGKNDYIPNLNPDNPAAGRMDLRTYIKLVKEDDSQVKAAVSSGDMMTVIPTRMVSLDVDTSYVRKAGVLPDGYTGPIPSAINWDLGKNNLLKSDLLMLDMIVTNNWKRPIYFASTLQGSNYMGLKQYMYLEGMAYRLLPIASGSGDGGVNAEKMYDHMMKKFYYRGLNDSTRFFDENYRRFPLSLRNSFVRLADALANEGQTEKAKEVIKKCFEAMPDAAIPYDPYVPRFVGVMLKVGMKSEAAKITQIMRARSVSELKYYGGSGKNSPMAAAEIQNNLFIIQELMLTYARSNEEAKASELEELLKQYAYLLPNQGGGGEYADE